MGAACFFRFLKIMKEGRWDVSGGVVGDLGMRLFWGPHLCWPPSLLLSLVPGAGRGVGGKPSSFLIYSSTGVQCCFGSDPTLQFLGMRLLRIRWQGGLGEAGSQLRALCCS